MHSIFQYNQPPHYGRSSSQSNGNQIRYSLQVCQQPIRARMCGFGEKDRRPVDPPPIVKLIMTKPDGSPVPESSVDWSGFIVCANLYCKRCKDERGLVINPSSIPSQASGSRSSIISLNEPSCTRNLMGSTVSSAYLLRDHDDKPGIYFIFNDISVRTEGSFTLRFAFADLGAMLFNSHPSVKAPINCDVFSEAFTVYSAKKFPGMTDSTTLSRLFRDQGIKLSIRKDKNKKRSHPANDNQNNNNIQIDEINSSPKSTATLSSESSPENDNDPILNETIAPIISDEPIFYTTDKNAYETTQVPLDKRRKT